MIMTDTTTIIFDVGSTIVNIDYDQIIGAAAESGVKLNMKDLRLAEHSGKLLIDEQTVPIKKNTDKSKWDNYLKEIFLTAGYPSEKINSFLTEVKRLDSIGFGIWSKKNSEADDILGVLKNRGYNLGIISNADGRIAGLLDFLDLACYFNAVIDSHIVGVEKPDPLIFKIMLEKLDCPPEKAVYIGDLYSVDVLGARSAGIIPILIDPFDQYDVDNCIKIFSLTELLNYFPEKS